MRCPLPVLAAAALLGGAAAAAEDDRATIGTTGGEGRGLMPATSPSARTSTPSWPTRPTCSAWSASRWPRPRSAPAAPRRAGGSPAAGWLVNQRVAQAAVCRAAAFEAWLRGGVERRDLCAGP